MNSNDGDIPLWRDDLQDLQREFDAGAIAYPGFGCVLIHAGPGEHDRLREYPFPVSAGNRVILGGAGIYKEAADPAQNTLRQHYYIGDKAAFNLFAGLVRDAECYLSDLPTEQLQSISADSPKPNWIWSMFEMAWQGRKYSPLRAEKRIWDMEHTGQTTFPYDTDRLKGILHMLPGNLGDSIRGWSKKLPDFYCSHLPDVFVASRNFIKILLRDQ